MTIKNYSIGLKVHQKKIYLKQMVGIERFECIRSVKKHSGLNQLIKFYIFTMIFNIMSRKLESVKKRIELSKKRKIRACTIK